MTLLRVRRLIVSAGMLLSFALMPPYVSIAPGAVQANAFKAETRQYVQRLDDFFHRVAGAPVRR